MSEDFFKIMLIVGVIIITPVSLCGILIYLLSITGIMDDLNQSSEKKQKYSNDKLYLMYAMKVGCLIISLSIIALTFLMMKKYYLSIESHSSIRFYIPYISFSVILFSIMMSVFFAPRKLKISAGVALGFLSAAYAYDAWLFTKNSIDDIAKKEIESVNYN